MVETKIVSPKKVYDDKTKKIITAKALLVTSLPVLKITSSSEISGQVSNSTKS